MTREDYLKQLENNLLSLTTEEKNEALQYYTDYFEEAGDDNKVMAELGSPEDLAKTIKEKFANVPVKSKKENDQNDNDGNESSAFDAMYFSYDASSVKNINFNFGAAQVVVIPGDKYSIETRGLSAESLHCYLGSDGNLSVTNEKKVNLNFFSHDRKSRVIPRVLITVPQSVNIERLKVVIGAGSFETRDINLKCQDGYFEVGAGNLLLKKIYGGRLNFRCGMGNLVFDGKTTGICNIDCGMGAVKLNVEGKPEDYSYDVKVGLGDFRFNNEKKSGVCQYVNDVRKDNHFSVNCGMGSVCIKMD